MQIHIHWHRVIWWEDPRTQSHICLHSHKAHKLSNSCFSKILEITLIAQTATLFFAPSETSPVYPCDSTRTSLSFFRTLFKIFARAPDPMQFPTNTSQAQRNGDWGWGWDSLLNLDWNHSTSNKLRENARKLIQKTRNRIHTSFGSAHQDLLLVPQSTEQNHPVALQAVPCAFTLWPHFCNLEQNVKPPSDFFNHFCAKFFSNPSTKTLVLAK